jgi:hypothetical protein
VTNVPIRIYDQYTLALIGEVDYYEQAFFTRSLTGYGSFTIVINYNITNAYLFAKGTIVQFGSSVKKIGVIEDIQKGIGEDGKGSQTLTITGVQAKGIFTRRIIIPGTGNDYYAQNDNAETVIKSTIADQCGATAPADRKFPLLNVIADSGRGGVYALQEFNTNLGTILTAVAESQDPYIGFDFSLNAATAKLDFDIIVGLDRRDSQTVNPRVCFSSEFDTLRSATIKDQSSGYRNVIYVGGQGDGSDKTVVQVNDTVEPTGIDRREEYIDSSSLQSVDDLTTAGESELNALKQATLTIEAQALVSSQLTYGVDYDIGDLVNIKEYGTVFDAQITEVTESWAHGSYEVSHVFGKQAQSITSVVKSTKSGLDQTNTSKSSIGWKTATISYAITADIVQDYSDITADVIILTGATGANRNLTLRTPDAAGIGRKLYTILVLATGGHTITVKTAAAGTGTVVLVSTGTPYTREIYVDASGNVRSLPVATTTMAGLESAADKTKLDGIAAGAEVNVNADWSSASGDSQILNKPAALTFIGGLTPAADRLPYYTSASAAALATFTSFARTLLDDADASTMRTTLGAPPTSHASSAATYGVGSGTNYGHVKLYTSITDGVTDGAPDSNSVFDALALKANLASPTFTGTPAAPTAAYTDNDTQLATTAFVRSLFPLKRIDVVYNDASAHTYTPTAGWADGTEVTITVPYSSAAATTFAAPSGETVEGGSTFVVHGAKVSAAIDSSTVTMKKQGTEWKFVAGEISGSSSTMNYIKFPSGKAEYTYWGNTSSSQGGNITIAHGLTSSNIVSLTGMVEYQIGSFISEEFSLTTGYCFSIQADTTYIYVGNVSGNSANILSKPFRIFVQYRG